MTNAHHYEIEDYRDVSVQNTYKDYVESGLKTESNSLQNYVMVAEITPELQCSGTTKKMQALVLLLHGLKSTITIRK